MKIKLLKQLLFLGMMLCVGITFSQTVTGTVSDADGPLPGVSVLIKGTTTGTSTDFDGKYSLDNVASDATLVFSFVGYKTKEVLVNGQSTIDVVLESDAQALDEVVIVGYGQTTVRDATGAIETVKAEELNKGVTTSPNELIQGRVAGVQVVQASGEPGAGSNIRIRGVGSPRAGNDPLIVVDGVPLNNAVQGAGGSDFGFGTSTARNPLAFINSNDIESMTVLKDASATAIYGSRAANGVILITTKKGKSGAPKIEVSTNIAFSSLRNSPDMLNGPTHASLTEQLGGTPAGSANVDGIEEITDNAVSTTNNISIAAGNEKAKYRLSLGYQDIEGIIKETGQEKYSGGFNSDFRFFENDRLKITTSLLATHLNDLYAPIGNTSDFKGSLVGAALQWNPTRSLFNEDGTFNQFSDTDPNPLAYLQYFRDKGETSRILGSLGVEFDFTDNLKYKFQMGLDRFESVRRASLSPDFNLQGNFGIGRAAINNDYAFSQTYTHTLGYAKEFSDSFKLDALVGYESVINTRRGDFTSVQGFVVDPGQLSNFLAGATETPVVSAYQDPTDDLQSFFARTNLSFGGGKYLLTLNFRADGSSKFGENNEYGYFPSGAFAWNIGEESFAPDFFSNLKLRLGYGQVGNSNFPAGSAQERFSFFQGTSQLVNVANPDLTWETSTNYNVGIDFGIIEGRLNGSIDYFVRETEDLLFQREAIQPAPATRFWDNLDGTVVNKGLEITLDYNVVNNENFTWDLGTNFSFLSNEMQDFPFGDNDFQVGFTNGQGGGVPVQRIANNQPLFAFFLPIFNGYDDSGLPVFEDINGNGTGDPSTDRTFVGDPNPDVLVGIRSYMKYKNFDLTINMNGSYGQDVFNNTASAITQVRSAFPGRNVSADYDVLNIDSGATNAASTLYLESGDFLRLTNVTLGYDLNASKIADWLNSARLFVTGQNLFVITPYSGFDPEVNTVTFNADGIPSFGIEYAPYPTATTISLGLNVSF